MGRHANRPGLGHTYGVSIADLPLAPTAPAAPGERARLSWLAVTASLASAASAVIHGAAIPTHFDHGTRYGVAFVVMTAALAIAACVSLTGRRAALAAVAAINVAIIALWFVAHTTSWTGDKEAVGFTDAVATMLEAGAAAAALGALATPVARRARPAAAALTALSIALLTVPAVAQAGDHAHGGDHGHAEEGAAAPAAGSISGIFAGAAHSHGAATSAACTPTAEQVAAADRLVADTTLALQRWRDPNAAVSDGFSPLGFEPNGVNHYMNPSFLRDGKTLDPARPESILYGRNKDGSLFPVGAMYMMDDKNAPGPQIGGCLTQWHAHGFPFARPGEVSTQMMHVWTIPLPGGPFAEHVEADYARIYLGIEGIDTDGNSTNGSGAGGRAQAAAGDLAAFESFLAKLDNGSGFGIGAVLNAVSVHRSWFCDPNIRPLIESRSGDKRAMDRVCDPLINGPLPGAKAPDLTTLIALLATRR